MRDPAQRKNRGARVRALTNSAMALAHRKGEYCRAEVLERYDNWTDWDETAICKLLEVDHHKAGVSQRAASRLINGMYPGHQHIPFLGQVITFIFFELASYMR